MAVGADGGAGGADGGAGGADGGAGGAACGAEATESACSAVRRESALTTLVSASVPRDFLFGGCPNACPNVSSIERLAAALAAVAGDGVDGEFTGPIIPGAGGVP